MSSSSTPSIRVSQHQRYASPPSCPSFQPDTNVSPMPIPRVQDVVPPPLPPPTTLPEISTGKDPGWQWGNDPASTDFGRAAAVKPGSSLLGGELRNPIHSKEFEHTRNSSMDDGRRGSSLSTITGITRDHDMPDAQQPQSDEESASRTGSNYRLQSERRLEQTTLEGSSNAYDKQLLSRIGGPSTPDSKRQSVSYGSGMQETAQLAQAESERRNSQLRPLTVPGQERRQNSISDSPANTRFPTSMPSSGAISPGFAGFWEQNVVDSSRLHTRNGSLSSSHRGSYDNTMFANDEFEENRMSHLHIHDRSPPGEEYTNGVKAGTKRRASSPPRDLYYEDRASISSASGQNDSYRRSVHQLPDRGSPVARFQPSHSSLSSASSYAPRHGSFGSSLSIPSIPSSATSYASGRVSPIILSPVIDPELRARTPSGSGQSLKPSPILPNPQHGRTRTLSSSTQGGAYSSGPDSAPHSRQNSLSQIHGMYICECCPKKPKKFDTEDDLRLHESEKQYSCAYCPNRFKNKNEAERHQNSLHLRLHSWSCAALAGPEAAFHQSMAGSGADVCGYCGEEFSNPPRWEVRAEHLNHVHKFGECNKSKKFFRADHFRQHLKHSHAGTSGKWTNMLENACMKDEPVPEKRAAATGGNNAPQAPPALMVTTTGLSGSPVQCSNLLERDSRDC